MYRITENDVTALKRARLLRRIREQVADRVNDAESIELHEAIVEYENAKKRAYDIATTLDGVKQDFCIYYYVFGIDIPETARLINRSERQTWRIKASIEGV